MRAPRLVDLHTHGIGRVDTRTEDPYQILKIAASHGKDGTGWILPTIYPRPLSEMRKNMEAVGQAIRIQRSSYGTGAFTEITGEKLPAMIAGVHLEGPFLNPGMSGSLDGDAFLKPTLHSLQKLIDGYEDIVKIITIAPELPGALRIIEKCAASGIKVNMGHSDATYLHAADGKRAGATGVTHIFNAMRPFHHREPGLLGLGLLDEDLFIEVIADGVHLHQKTLAMIFALKRLDRIMLVSDSVKSGVKRRAPVYTRKGILAGSGIALRDSFVVLKKAGIPDAEIIQAARDNPAKYLAGESRLPIAPR